VPLGVVPVTVAVNVTDWFTVDGLTLEANAVVVVVLALTVRLTPLEVLVLLPASPP